MAKPTTAQTSRSIAAKSGFRGVEGLVFGLALAFTAALTLGVLG